MNTRLEKNLNNNDNIPKHVAIIMDGNRRWAKKRGKLRICGYKHSIHSIKDTINGCKELGIPYITLYVFSSENWHRPKEEIDQLMNLFHSYFKQYLKEIDDSNIRIIAIGELKKLSNHIQKDLFLFINKTKHNTSITLVLALSYGSKIEIIEATKKIVKQVLNGCLSIENIDDSLFQQNLYTKDIPDVDLVIRTSGEQRLSNFLLWQSAYAELYFTDILWPDFRKQDLFAAIENYKRRKRRFGKITE
ncbi:isoprenyl transferase [Blattabacterium cuenoti]|uniref:isoprenyl transferase n=1 Tax=Blattabacterium cuenoti TaxID=1653831 RepID=UPI00163BE66A|nr:isoprenyl transferase [Blattabacterium cuenoti]